MDLSTFKPNTPRKDRKRIARGGKRGTTAGKGTKGQKSRAGYSKKVGFRGGDNPIWQLFPKTRGAAKKPGNKRPHRKHRYFRLRHPKPWTVNLRDLTPFTEGETVSPTTLIEKGVLPAGADSVKILGTGALKKKLSFNDVMVSESAKAAIEKAGGTVR